VSADTTSEGADKKAKKRSEQVAHFINEIAAASKREKDYRKKGNEVIEMYTGKKSNPFAILFSNTETMLPALYSAVPRPVVQRRFKDEDPLGKLAAKAGERGLEFLLDTNTQGYETFDSALRVAVLDGLLPGRGVTSVKYEAEVQDTAPAEGAEPIPVKNWETVCPDSISWDRFLHGYAKKWSKVPWISYEMHLDKDQCLDELKFDPEMVAKITFTEGESEDDEAKEGEGKSDEERNLGERKTALFYQIWDKDGGQKVRYLCPQYKEDFCKVEDDPLGITGFFNCPKPIQFLEKSNDLLPIALYSLYEEQAEELNNLTRRIKAVIASIKAKAFYDTELGEDIKRLIEEDEPALVPADKSSSLAAEKGMDNAVWFWPVEKLIIVLRELYAAREACKHVIYEITGIADILRGNTNASETLGAQEIKEKWGTLRLKRLQKEVQRYARDMLRMMLDVAAQKFSERTWAQMTGLPFLLEEKYNELTQVARALEAQVQQEQQQAAMMGQPVQPGPSVQKLQQVQQQLQTPRWSLVLDALRDDMQRAYRIDIETNSTVEPEAVEDQKNISDVMTALGQFLNGITPLVVSGSMPFQAAQAMMLAIVRRYRFGSEIEDYIKAMVPPKPPDDGKDKAAQAAEAKAAKAEITAQQAGMKEQQTAAQVKHIQDEAKLKDMHATATQAQAAKQAELDRREQALAKEEEARALREELANSRLETQMVKDAAARDKLANDLKLMVKTLEGNLKIAQKSAADATTAAKQQGAKDADAQKNAKAQAQAKQSEQAMAGMMKGFQDVVGKLNETLAVLAGGRELTVQRKDGKITGGRSQPVGA
jgi:hypothetical protein